MRYGERGKTGMGEDRMDAAFADWHEIISYIPGFWEEMVTRGKGKTQNCLPAGHIHSLLTPLFPEQGRDLAAICCPDV